MEKVIDYLIKYAANIFEMGVQALFVLIVGWQLAKFVTNFVVNAMTKAKLETSIIGFVKSVLGTFLKVVVIISVLGILGFPTTSLVAIFGTAGAALALGFKDNLGNFVSGIIILFTKPFVVGDFIEVSNFTGTVKEIQIMYTILNTIDNKSVVVPNSQMTTTIIVNSTHETTRRVELKFDLSYNQDFEQAKRIVHQVISKQPQALLEPMALVRINDLKDSSVELLVRVWCKTEDYLDLRFDLIENIKKEFDTNQIEIPYNQLDIHIKQKD